MMSHLAVGVLWMLLSAAPEGVTGTVTDAQTGQPLPGVIVIVESTGPQGPYEERRVVTDAEGKYRFSPPGSKAQCFYDLRFEKELYELRSFQALQYGCRTPYHFGNLPLSPALADLFHRVIDYPRPYAGRYPVILKGTVTGLHTREPIVQATVGAISRSLYRPRVAFTNQEGHYQFPPLPPGTYTLTFTEHSHNDHWLTDVTLRPGRTYIIRTRLEEQISYEQ